MICGTSGLTIVAAVTSNLRVASLSVGVLLKAGEGGLRRDSVVHCGHIFGTRHHIMDSLARNSLAPRTCLLIPLPAIRLP